jgi:hypothetical protein
MTLPEDPSDLPSVDHWDAVRAPGKPSVMTARRRDGFNEAVGRWAETAALSAFWRWWSAAGVGLVTAAVMTGAYGDLPELVSAMVAAIHPEQRPPLLRGIMEA